MSIPCPPGYDPEVWSLLDIETQESLLADLKQLEEDEALAQALQHQHDPPPSPKPPTPSPPSKPEPAAITFKHHTHDVPDGIHPDVWRNLPEETKAEVLAQIPPTPSPPEPAAIAFKHQLDEDEELARKLQKTSWEDRSQPAQISIPLDDAVPDGIHPDVWRNLPEEMKAELRLQMMEPVPSSTPFLDSLNVDEEMVAAAAWEELQRASGLDPHTHSRASQNQNHERLQFTPDSVGTRTTVVSGPLTPATHDPKWKMALTTAAEFWESIAEESLENPTDPNWTDPDFPPTVSAIDGIKGDGISAKANAVPMCRCNPKAAARLRKVAKENMNQGRAFFSCAKARDKG
ncbi:hypothetical protein HDU96_004879, partial [Phlyctochytrium bullatum]